MTITNYTLVEKDTQKHLGLFLTSLSLYRLVELMNIVDEDHLTDPPFSKSNILFGLIKKEDPKFKIIRMERIEI